jgi:hypothetical protein
MSLSAIPILEFNKLADIALHLHHVMPSVNLGRRYLSVHLPDYTVS